MQAPSGVAQASLTHGHDFSTIPIGTTGKSRGEAMHSPFVRRCPRAATGRRTCRRFEDRPQCRAVRRAAAGPARTARCTPCSIARLGATPKATSPQNLRGTTFLDLQDQVYVDDGAIEIDDAGGETAARSIA